MGNLPTVIDFTSIILAEILAYSSEAYTSFKWQFLKDRIIFPKKKEGSN